jgi:hypothetical protein
VPEQATLSLFAGLRFTRNIVRNATRSTRNHEDVSADLQGSLRLHAACPGWDASAPLNEELNGTVDLVIGVLGGHLQRAFEGDAENCRFVTLRQDVESTMHLEIDFGNDVELSEALPEILVRATNIRGSASGKDFDLGDSVIHFRLADDRSIETLVDLEALETGLTGTVLLAIHVDGTVGLRERAGEWQCATEGSDPCELVP